MHVPWRIRMIFILSQDGSQTFQTRRWEEGCLGYESSKSWSWYCSRIRCFPSTRTYIIAFISEDFLINTRQRQEPNVMLLPHWRAVAWYSVLWLTYESKPMDWRSKSVLITVDLSLLSDEVKVEKLMINITLKTIQSLHSRNFSRNTSFPNFISILK